MNTCYKPDGNSTVSPYLMLVKKQDEDKRGGVKDAGGTTWWIASKLG